MYLMYHEELESLSTHFPEIERARFWMTFGDAYIKHVKVLQNVGMTAIDAGECGASEIVPLQFLKAVLPDPGDLGELTKGKTCIGDIVTGRSEKDGSGEKTVLHLQHLRPRGVLSRGRQPGGQLHHRRAGDDRRGAWCSRALAGRACGTWNSSIPTISWTC